MTPLPHNTSDADLVAFIDHWAALMEAEDYKAAFAFTDYESQMHWTPELIRAVIKAYGDELPGQKVTLDGQPTDIVQRKKVSRWQPLKGDCIGEIWYDLNINGLASDLTATFSICGTPQGLIIKLDDIHVM